MLTLSPGRTSAVRTVTLSFGATTLTTLVGAGCGAPLVGCGGTGVLAGGAGVLAGGAGVLVGAGGVVGPGAGEPLVRLPTPPLQFWKGMPGPVIVKSIWHCEATVWPWKFVDSPLWRLTQGATQLGVGSTQAAWNV